VIVMAMARRKGLRFGQIRAAPVARACRDTLKLSEHHSYGDDDDQLRAKHFLASFEEYHDSERGIWLAAGSASDGPPPAGGGIDKLLAAVVLG
jgi:hypothetical protein